MNDDSYNYSSTIMCVQASDSCREEAARLWERENLLKGQLQKQELLLHRLQLLNQPRNYKVRGDQSQDKQYAGQGTPSGLD